MVIIRPFQLKGKKNMAKTGRPKAEKPKNIAFSIRIDKETEERLDKYCKRQNVSKGEAIRRAIRLLPDK